MALADQNVADSQEVARLRKRLSELEHKVNQIGSRQTEILTKPFSSGSAGNDIGQMGSVKTYLEIVGYYTSAGTSPGTVPTPNYQARRLWVDLNGDGHLKIRKSDGSDVDLELGGVAASSAQFLALAADASLSNERVFTPGTALSAVDGGAGNAYTLNHAAIATGDLHTQYLLVSGTRAMTGDLTLAAAGSIEDSSGTNRITITASGAIVFTNRTQMSSGRFNKTQGADVASANDLTLGDDGNTFEITGTTQINAITTTNWQNGSMITLLFTSNPAVKHNTAGGAGTAVMLFNGAVDFPATAGDTVTLVLCEIGGTQAWREVGRAII